MPTPIPTAPDPQASVTISGSHRRKNSSSVTPADIASTAAGHRSPSRRGSSELASPIVQGPRPRRARHQVSASPSALPPASPSAIVVGAIAPGGRPSVCASGRKASGMPPIAPRPPIAASPRKAGRPYPSHSPDAQRRCRAAKPIRHPAISCPRHRISA